MSKETAIILAVGEELLEGSTVDTNSAFIAQELLKLGISVSSIQAVPDDINLIAKAVQLSLLNSNIVITTGGLGPTFDDVTAKGIALGCNTSVSLNQEAYDHIKNFLKSKKVYTLTQGQQEQANIPTNALLLPNKFGTAMGFYLKLNIEDENKIIFSMPGVPYEMYPMFTNHVVKIIKKYFRSNEIYISNLRFAMIPESEVDVFIKTIGIPDSVKCIINASIGEVIVKIRSHDYQLGESFSEKIKNKFFNNFLFDGIIPLEEALFDLLLERKLSLSVAESCTSGLLSSILGNISGVSAVFKGGVIAYNNDIKEKILGVSSSVIEKFGAVSKECAIDMVKGLSILTGSDCAIAITGIAGPNGGSLKKPVGTVFIALKVFSHISCNLYAFSGDRATIRGLASKSALSALIQELNKLK